MKFRGYLKGNPALVNVSTDSLKDFFTEWHFLAYGHSNVQKMLVTLAEKRVLGTENIIKRKLKEKSKPLNFNMHKNQSKTTL